MLIEPIHDLDVVLHQQNPPGRYERCGLDFVQSRHPQTPYQIQLDGCQYDLDHDLESYRGPFVTIFTFDLKISASTNHCLNE